MGLDQASDDGVVGEKVRLDVLIHHAPEKVEGFLPLQGFRQALEKKNREGDPTMRSQAYTHTRNYGIYILVKKNKVKQKTQA